MDKKITQQDIKKTNRDVIIVCIMIVIIIAIVNAVSNRLNIIISYKHYNCGVCENCDGCYEFLSVSPHFNSDYYYYKCNRCSHIIRTTYNFSEDQ